MKVGFLSPEWKISIKLKSGTMMVDINYAHSGRKQTFSFLSQRFSFLFFLGHEQVKICAVEAE